jgi:hypothetical protein
MRAGFDRLHPKLAERFSVGLDSGLACIATGTMSRIWHGAAFITPFLQLGASRHILFPEQGSDVPFTMENWPYLDRAGRETVTFNRTFELPHRRRRFDATMIFDEPSGRLVDYLGTHQHVAADLTLRADDHGGLVIRSGEQRFRMRRVDDREGRFHIDVRVTNQWFGQLFGYLGSFTCRYVDLGQAPAPAVAKPAMEETRV